MNIKALKEKRNDILVEIDQLCNKVEKESRALSEDEERIVTEKMKSINDIDKTIEIENKRRTLMNDIQYEDISDKEKSFKEEKSFLNYVRNKDASALSVSENGAIIPKTIANRIVDQVYELCPVLKLATVVHVKGEFSIPIYDNTTDVVAGYIDDLAELTAQAGKFKNITLSTYIVGSLAIISKSLINNTDFDLLTFIIGRVALGFTRVISEEFCLGNAKIKGLFVPGNVTNTVSVDKISDTALITIQNYIPTEYQANSVWIMNRNTLLKCKLLKDTNGRSLLNDNLVQGYGWTILGQRVIVDMNVPDETIFYGDLKGYWIKFSKELEINVLYEQFAIKHAIGVYGYAEVDGKPIEQQKLAVLTVNSKA